jgi:DNA-binding SARP family transcriptional activator/tetratricopeptide (TPR) repeat protein
VVELHVRVLGQLHARAGDAEPPLGPSRQRAVFAVLATNAGRAVSRDELIDAVWGDSAPASAGGSLHTYVSGLRRALGPAAGRLATVPGGYQLDVSTSDVAEFTRLRDEATARLRDDDPRGAVAALDAALALWRGEPYAGVAGPFAEQERARLAEMRLAVRERRARTLLDLGGSADLVVELQGLVREHPLHEALYELLMRALAQAGRTAEALDVYQHARRTLVDELGVEPGPALRRVQWSILEVPEAEAAAPVRVLPAHVSRPGKALVGRTAELDVLAGLVAGLAEGRGGAVWIDGDAGIGKSELLTAAFAEVGCQIAWGVADELGQRVPRQVLLEALGLETMALGTRPRAPGLDTVTPDTRPRALAEQVAADPDAALLGYVRDTCRRGPLVLVVDDMHWADDASMLLWGRLAAAAGRLPLLLVAASRPEPGRRDVGRLRDAVADRGGVLLELAPLTAPEVETLIGGIVGAAPGASLRALAARTEGNPLYTREMAAELVRQRSVRVVDGLAEVDGTIADRLPGSLLAAVGRTLEALTVDTREVLRLAALLGMEFTAADLAALTGRSPVLLTRVCAEAVRAHVVVESGDRFTFRHPFLRQALHDAIPGPMRATLRRHAAEMLARAGAVETRIAEQLVADATVIDGWVVRWLVSHHAELSRRAPRIAADLLRQALATDVPDRPEREILLVSAVKLWFRLEEYPEAEARAALAMARDPADRAEMRQLLAAMRYRRGDAAEAIALLGDAVDDPAVPEIWRTRHRVLLANFRRGDLTDLDRAESEAVAVHAAADSPYEAAFALQTRWLIDSIRRDHRSALAHLDTAIETLGDTDAALLFDLLDNRVFALQNLDRLAEAQRTLAWAADVAARHRLPAGLQVASAVQYYWLGRWDDALAEIGWVADDDPAITFRGTREPPAVAMLLHGVAALIAGRRGDAATARAHLDAADAQLPATSAERESCDFLLMAHALMLEQQGRPKEALARLAPLWEPSYAPMMLRHQWLPDVVRLALAVGDTAVAETAARISDDEARRETVPARAFAAAARIRTLRTGDPAGARSAAKHYRAVGRVPELAAALEEAGDPEALELYGRLRAAWDLRRASTG